MRNGLCISRSLLTNVAHHVKFTFDLFSRLKRETHSIVGKKLRISFQ